jgi:outer membrane protein TolC
VSLRLAVLRLSVVMQRLSLIVFALSLLATIDAVAQQQGPAPATNPPPPSITVVKAQLQQQQRDRDLAEALLGAQKSRLDLAVLLFADPRTDYTLSPGPIVPLPARADVDANAMRLNPELRQAMASLRVNTLQVRQSEILRDVAHTALTATQRRLVDQLDESYSEAATVHDALQSLEQSVQTATESLRLTRLRYTAGEATVLEVVDAENSLTAAEIAREDGTVRYQLAMTNLKLLTGAI